MWDSARLALGTLTALPVPAPRKLDQRVAGNAMLLAPVAALPLAATAVLVVLGGELLGLPALVSATLAVAAVALTSRGLHLDGLADTADGLAASYHRERALRVMRSGDSGPAAMVTLLLVLLVQCGALAGAVSAGHGAVAVALAVVAGRGVLVLGCARGVPSAREDGLGATVAGSVALPLAVLVPVSLAGLAGLAPGLPWWQGPLAVLAAFVVAGALLARAVSRFGGVTGDVLGACVESATAAALVVASV